MIRVLLTSYKSPAVRSNQEKPNQVSLEGSKISLSSSADYSVSAPLDKALSLVQNSTESLLVYYFTLARSYASHYKDKEAFLKQMQESNGESGMILETFQGLSEWGVESDLTKIIAFLSSDKSPLLFNILRTNYYKVYLMDCKSFQQFLRTRLGDMWKPSYSLNSYIFYELIRRKKDISKNKRVQKVAKAIQVAENTTILILNKGSELINWTAQVLDKSWNQCPYLPLLYKNVKTKTHLLLLCALKHSPTLLTSNFDKAKLLCSQIELHLPHYCFSTIHRGLSLLRLVKIQRFFKQYVWDACDLDGDGVVTIGDLYVSVRKFDIYKALYLFLKQYQTKSKISI